MISDSTTSEAKPQSIDSIIRSDAFADRLRRLLFRDAPRLRRLMAYYANPLRACPVSSDDAGSARPYRLGQEWGLPSRITGVRVTGADRFINDCSGSFAAQAVPGVARKEVVVENDIGWRVDTLVDYLFGKAIVINSAAPDAARRAEIDELLRLIIAQNGGITFLQQMAQMGSVYGFVDVLVKFDTSLCDDESMPGDCGASELGQPAQQHDREQFIPPDGARPSDTAASPSSSDAESSDMAPGASYPSPAAQAASRIELSRLARRIRLEIVEPTRALPLLSCDDYRKVDAYAQVYEVAKPASETPALRTSSRRALGLLGRMRARAGNLLPGFLWLDDAADRLKSSSEDRKLVVEIVTDSDWRRYEDGALAASGANSLGRLPLVHVQNTCVPFEYSGTSDVEPLIPLQDELNTRMSDRAYRLTLQSFKMYLAKGIEGVNELPVGPGRVWVTDNENAEVQAFGGDVKTFSEDNHIADVRQALDKISGVTPIAAGALKGRIGRLTSAAALRVTMLALLAKTERRRTIYGRAVEQICELSLAWLNAAGLYPTDSSERRIEIHWPNPVPVNDIERLDEAQAKLKIGVPQDVVLRELGYQPPASPSQD
jgi:hypothetical protein